MVTFIGWGSLLWNYDTLKIIDTWKHTTSLKLPLEFSRISMDGRMTLVIDKINGLDNGIYYGDSEIEDVNLAINILKKREKTVSANIAYFNLKNNKFRFNNTPPEIAKRILQWGVKNNKSAIIWTDINNNWKEIRGVNYSIENAMEYFEEQDINTRMRIIVYIYGATIEAGIKTPFSRIFINRVKTLMHNWI